MYLPKTEYYELPNKYNKTVVRLLVQSPTRMFVYWEVDEDSIKYFESNKMDYSSAQPVLKVKNIFLKILFQHILIKNIYFFGAFIYNVFEYKTEKNSF